MSIDRELKIVIKADGSVAVNEMKVVSQSTDELEKQLKEARSEFEKLQAELKNIAKTSSAAGSEFESLQSDTSALKEENRRLVAELSKMQSELGRISDQSKSLEVRLSALTGKTNSLGLTTKQVDALVSTLASDMEELSKRTSRAGDFLEKTKGALDGFHRTSQKFGDGVNKIKENWAAFSTGLNQSLEIIGKAKRIFDKTWEISNQGAIFEEAKDAFDAYTQSIGKNSDDILNKLRKASGGTINDMNMIKTASLAMSLGVTTDSTKMANLLEVARNKARLFGINTQQAFEDIVTGIGRASPKILDNLGIRIPAAFEEMTDGMSDAQKVAVLFEMTLEEGNKQLKAMGSLTNSRADDMRAFQADVDNLKFKFGDLISLGFRPFVNDLRTDVIPAIEDTILVLKTLAGATDIFDRRYNGEPAGQFAKKKELYDELAQERRELAGALQSPGELFKDQNDSWFVNDSVYAKYKENLKLDLKNVVTDREVREAIQARIKEINLQLKSAGAEVEKELEAASNKKFIEDVFARTEREFANEAAEAARKAGETTKTSGKNAKEAAEYYYSLAKAIDSAYASGQKLPVSLNNAQAGMESLGDAALSFADNLRLSNSDWFRGELVGIAKEAAEVASMFGKVKINADLFDEKNLANAKTAVQYLQKGITGYLNLTVPSQTTSAWDQYGGNILSAIWSAGTDSDDKKQKQKLSGTIAEAVAQGFANADLSNFANSIGSMLSQVLSRSVAQNNPILNAAGGVNWGNLGINIGTNLAINALTQPGRFFGGRQDKFKEQTLQAASDLKSQMGQAWVKSHETSLLPYLTEYDRNQLAAGRYSYNGTQTGYSWSDSGNGIWSDKTRTYNLIDQGASAALAKLTKAMENAEKYNRSVEMGYELQVAKGYDYQALAAQTAAFQQAAARAYGGEYSLPWTDGTKDTADLAEAAHEIKMAAAEMARQLAQTNAERTTSIAQGFSKYMPWLDTIQTSASIPSNLRLSMRSFQVPGLVGTDSLTAAQQYDAFSALQTSLMDRNIPSYLLDMVKQAGTAGYELEELKLTDPELYTERYLEQIEKQMTALDEVMRRQEQIFNDAAKSYEERVSALDVYEQSMESYHQAKLDKLRTERQLEEQEKQIMAEARQAKMESALSLIGEVSQRGDRIMIIQAGDSTTAIKELMAEFADNPEVTAVLQSTLEKTEAQTRWGK
jgi:uncharacterized protein (DUF3084 family)